MPRARAGTSLIELLVALVVLEFMAVATLQAVLATQRIARTVAAGAAIDVARLDAVRMAAADPSCHGAPSPTLRALSLAAHPTRPATTVLLRCGR